MLGHRMTQRKEKEMFTCKESQTSEQLTKLKQNNYFKDKTTCKISSNHHIYLGVIGEETELTSYNHHIHKDHGLPLYISIGKAGFLFLLSCYRVTFMENLKDFFYFDHNWIPFFPLTMVCEMLGQIGCRET